MCGIFGIIGHTTTDTNTLVKMSRALRHRGPDDEGFLLIDGKMQSQRLWGEDTPSSVRQHPSPYQPKQSLHDTSNHASRILLAHRRLSIQDLSPQGHQPMHYMGRYWIVFNGEVYNHPELRKTLATEGYRFHSTSDTEVIMAAYHRWGEQCLQHFNGMWAFVLYDQQEDKLFISRDRFGVKPLYYALLGKQLIFASEIKALLCHSQISKQPDLQQVTAYLDIGAREYGSHTMFAQIRRLESCHYIHDSLDNIATGNFAAHQFWELKNSGPSHVFNVKQANILKEQYLALLEDAIRIRLRADVEIGSALSGGLDSSSIVYLINRQHAAQGITHKQITFSTVYRHKLVQHCDESHFIEKMAKYLGVESYQIEPNPSEIPEQHEKMIWHMDTPPDNTLMSSWHTFRLVKSRGIRVTLDGQGADEQLAGYTGYLAGDLIGLPLYRWPMAIQGYIGKYPNKAIATQIPYAMLVKLGGQQACRHLFSHTKAMLHEKLWIGVMPLEDRLIYDCQHNLQTLLHYADRTSMAFNVESRMPFLDYRLAEFLTTVGPQFKLHQGWSKYLARLAFDQKLPDEITWRKEKMGWPIPEEAWFNGPLQHWFRKYSNPLAGKISSSLSLRNTPPSMQKSIRIMNLNTWEKCFSL